MRPRFVTASVLAAASIAAGCARPPVAPPPIASGEIVPVVQEAAPALPSHRRHGKARQDNTGLTDAQKQRVFSDFNSWESRKDGP
jgi:Spy/CpxP family protein refolding chaperone